MKRLDRAFLKFFHNLSNQTYKRFGINNYNIATIILFISIFASLFIAYKSILLAQTDTNQQVAKIREGSSILAVLFFTTIALSIFWFQKEIGNFLSRKYDTQNTEPFFNKYILFSRWFFIFMYPVSIIIGSKWWGMLDTFLLGISIMFLSCEPPKMEIRMSRIWKN